MADEEALGVMEEKKPEATAEGLEEGSNSFVDTSKSLDLSPKNKFSINLDDVIKFCLPKGYQHPLVASRLIVFGMYGPLDEKGRLRTGYKGNRILMEYELDAMCLQVERDDIASIYLHRGNDLGMLTKDQQESIIAQADAHLKRAKGKAMLPKLTDKDVYQMFSELDRDEYGHLDFNDMQKMIVDFRDYRIKDYKRVFPALKGVAHDEDDDAPPPPINGTRPSKIWKSKLKGTVSSQIAPRTMFQKNKGLNNADVIKTTTKLMAEYNFQINEIDYHGDTTHLTTNCRLLREVQPKLPNPYRNKKTGAIDRDKWNFSTTMK